MPHCRNDRSEAHEDLERLSTLGRPLTPQEKVARSVAKEQTFLCHYGKLPCGWTSPREPADVDFNDSDARALTQRSE